MDKLMTKLYRSFQLSIVYDCITYSYTEQAEAKEASVEFRVLSKITLHDNKT